VCDKQEGIKYPTPRNPVLEARQRREAVLSRLLSGGEHANDPNTHKTYMALRELIQPSGPSGARTDARQLVALINKSVLAMHPVIQSRRQFEAQRPPLTCPKQTKNERIEQFNRSIVQIDTFLTDLWFTWKIIETRGETPALVKDLVTDNIALMLDETINQSRKAGIPTDKMIDTVEAYLAPSR
jgi:hypothetical protein